MAIAKSYLNDWKINENFMVKLRTLGNIQEISYCSRRNYVRHIRWLSKDLYINDKTGEINEIHHINNRSENLLEFSQSQKRLRDLINCNVVRPNEWKWITLTYAKNMTDTKKLYKDYQKFWQRFQYRFGKETKYIIACEPQARGAWHIHALIGFGKIAPFIPNETIEELWQQGFTKTNALNDIDNVGAYLTAYLGDIEATNENIQELREKGCIVPKKAITKHDFNIDIKKVNLDGTEKKFIKGGRLYMYPPKFNMYRSSRGLKKPIEEKMPYYDAKKRVGTLEPTYQSCIQIQDLDNDFENLYYYEYYNTLRNKSNTND